MLWWTRWRLNGNREAALGLVRALLDRKDVATLTALATDGRVPGVLRTRMLEGLVELRDPVVLPFFKGLLQSGDSLLAATGAKGLGAMRRPEATAVLLEAFQARSDLFFVLVDALGETADPAAAGPLHARMAGAPWGTASALVAALRRLPWKPSTPEDYAWTFVHHRDLENAAKQGAAAVRPLLGLVLLEETELRMPALKALTRILERQGHEVDSAVLEEVASVKDPETVVRSYDSPSPRCVFEEVRRQPYDLSPLRQVAKQELARRGRR